MKVYNFIMKLKYDFEIGWLNFKISYNRKKQLKVNKKILKSYKRLLEIKENPPSFLSSLLYCFLHPISFIKYFSRLEKKEAIK